MIAPWFYLCLQRYLKQSNRCKVEQQWSKVESVDPGLTLLPDFSEMWRGNSINTFLLELLWFLDEILKHIAHWIMYFNTLEPFKKCYWLLSLRIKKTLSIEMPLTFLYLFIFWRVYILCFPGVRFRVVFTSNCIFPLKISWHLHVGMEGGYSWFLTNWVIS